MASYLSEECERMLESLIFEANPYDIFHMFDVNILSLGSVLVMVVFFFPGGRVSVKKLEVFDFYP